MARKKKQTRNGAAILHAHFDQHPDYIYLTETRRLLLQELWMRRGTTELCKRLGTTPFTLKGCMFGPRLFTSKRLFRRAIFELRLARKKNCWYVPGAIHRGLRPRRSVVNGRKQCSKCREWKPAHRDYFYPIRSRGYWASLCILCTYKRHNPNRDLNMVGYVPVSSVHLLVANLCKIYGPKGAATRSGLSVKTIVSIRNRDQVRVKKETAKKILVCFYGTRAERLQRTHERIVA